MWIKLSSPIMGILLLNTEFIDNIQQKGKIIRIKTKYSKQEMEFVTEVGAITTCKEIYSILKGEYHPDVDSKEQEDDR